MKTLDAPLNVIKSDNFHSGNSFVIKHSRKAFKILSDQLYSHKVKAVIREASTNALDSYLLAQNQGQPKPDHAFTVHLPNRYELYFSVRDYGVGLSKEDVLHVYTTYFESTKTDSNDYTGCLGLGSKSPFSYTDNFSVTSYFNGEKSVYLAFVDSDGLPSITCVSQEECWEHNGLEVKVDVKQKDIEEFISEAKEIYRYFKIKPEITGQTIDIKSHTTPLFSGKTWNLYKHEYGSKPSILMGNIKYACEVKSPDYFGDLYYLQQNNVEIECPIGSLEVNPGRESLSLDEETTKYILQRYREVYDELVLAIKTELANTQYGWDRSILFNNKIKQEVKLPESVVDSLGIKQKYDVSTINVEAYFGGKSLETRNQIECNKKVFIKDIGKTIIKRFKQNYSEGYLIQPEQEVDFRTLCDIGPNTVFKKVSELSYQSSSYGSTPVVRDAYLFQSHNCYGNLANAWSRCSEIVPDSTIQDTYVFIKNYQIYHSGTHKPYYLKTIVELLESIGLDFKVYGVKPAYSRKLLRNNKLENFFDWYSVKVNSWIDTNKVKYRNFLAIEDTNYDDKMGAFAAIKEICNYTSNTTLQQLGDCLPDFHVLNQFSSIKQLTGYPGVTKIEVASEKVALDKMLNSVYAKYPMIKVFSSAEKVKKFNSEITQYLSLVG